MSVTTVQPVPKVIRADQWAIIASDVKAGWCKVYHYGHNGEQEVVGIAYEPEPGIEPYVLTFADDDETFSVEGDHVLDIVWLIKTKAEIEKLKTNWLLDPCWDIEYTEGFERYRAELTEWRKAHEQTLKQKEDLRLNERAIQLQCSVALVRYIERLEQRLNSLEAYHN